MIKIFVGTSSNGEDEKAEKALEYSLRKNSNEDIQIIWMKQSNESNSLYYGWDTSTWGTPFSAFRWSIPHACNYKGRAIYLDVDIINLKDISQLFNVEMHEKSLLMKKDEYRNFWLSSVILFDCEKLKEHMPDINFIKSWKNINHSTEITQLLNNHIGVLDPRWNMLDNQPLVIQDSWNIHFTCMPTQPWKPSWFKGITREHNRPDLVNLWESMYRNSLLEK